MADTRNENANSTADIALIVGGGPSISASCARLFADQGMKVAIRFSSVWWETEGDPLAWLVTEGQVFAFGFPPA